MQQMIFIADLIACSTCFGHHYARHQELESINPLNAELNPICHLLALLGGATIVVVSRLRVKHVVDACGIWCSPQTGHITLSPTSYR
jgi:hypothetical protein